MKMLCERAIEVQQDLYITFIDYKKGFDKLKVKHKDLLKMLWDIGIDDKALRVIRNLYLNQTAAIRLPDKTLTRWVWVVRGVRQGRGMLPDFFNLYSELILRVLEDVPEGIIVNGIRLNKIRYADDTAFITTWQDGGQRVLQIAEVSGENRGLSINCKKTKSLCEFPRRYPNQPSYLLQVRKPLSKLLRLTISVPRSQQTVEARRKLEELVWPKMRSTRWE